jgi:hypothetical protein
LAEVLLQYLEDVSLACPSATVQDLVVGVLQLRKYSRIYIGANQPLGIFFPLSSLDQGSYGLHNVFIRDQYAHVAILNS